MPASFTWPVRVFPQCWAAGVFPMTAPGAHRTYVHPTVALHLHDYSGQIWIGAQRYRLEPGDLTFSPPRIPSRYRLDEDGSHLCVHFHPARERSRSSSLRLPRHLRLGAQSAAARERLWRVIDHVRQANGNVESVAGHAASAALQELLLWLALQVNPGAATRRDSLADQALKKLHATLDTSLARRASIADLAHGAGLSSAYLARLFAHRYGMTLQHYLLQRRIELARHLLLASDLLVCEVGARVGLADPQYFNKQFRRVAGISPLAYRRKNR